MEKKGDLIMGLFGGRDKRNNYDEEVEQHELEMQKREEKNAQYALLVEQWEKIQGVQVEVIGSEFECGRKYKMYVDNGDIVFVCYLKIYSVYDLIPENLTEVRFGKEYICKESCKKEELVQSKDFVGEKIIKVEGIKFDISKEDSSDDIVTVLIKDMKQDFSPIMGVLENIHWRNYFNVIDIPEENFNVKVVNGNKFLGNCKYIMMRKGSSLIFVRASITGYDGRYVAVAEIKVKDILYYKSEGALRYEQQLSGGGGMGINYGSAILGGLLFGQAGAMIGSRQNEDIKSIESKTIEHDTRLITVSMKIDGNSYQVGFDINSELAFDWLLPEKKYDYVIQKRREQYEKSNK